MRTQPSLLASGFIALLLGVAVLSGCAPGTIESLIELQRGLSFSDKDELREAHKAGEAFEKKNRLYDDLLLQDYVNRVGQRIVGVARADRPEIPTYTFKVVKDYQLNAFTFGGGLVYFNAGLIARMEDEAQLAAVLAHEVAHVTKAHIRDGVRARYQILLGISVVKFGTDVAGAFVVPGLAQLEPLTRGVLYYSAQAAVSGHGRSQETQADDFGLEYAYRAGYDPREMPKVFELFLKEYGDPPPVEHFFYGTHPTNVARIKATTTKLEKKYKAEITTKRLAVNSEEFGRRTRKLVIEVGVMNYPQTENRFRDFIGTDGNKKASCAVL